MSLSASAKRLAQERSSSEIFLKTLQQAESGTKEAAPLSGELRANNLAMWHGIQFLARTGAEKLHFGRTDCENDGLRRFKLSWGTEEETIGYVRVDPSGRQCLAPARPHSGFHTKIFEILPLVFNQLAGSMIYPHLD